MLLMPMSQGEGWGELPGMCQKHGPALGNHNLQPAVQTSTLNPGPTKERQRSELSCLSPAPGLSCVCQLREKVVPLREQSVWIPCLAGTVPTTNQTASSFVSGPLPSPHSGHLVLLCHEFELLLEQSPDPDLGARLEHSVSTALRTYPIISHPYSLPLDSVPHTSREHQVRSSSSLE